MKRIVGSGLRKNPNTLPTIFDFFSCLFIVGMAFIPQGLWGFYFCFYGVFVAILGFNQPDVRKSYMPSLTLLSLIALCGLFIHSFLWSVNSITFRYLNFYLMFEGFAYVFFGCLTFQTLTAKGTNLRLFFLTLPIALIPYVKQSLYSGRGSIVFAMAGAFIIFCFLRGRRDLAYLMAILAATFLVLKFDWFCMKFACRIPIWKDMIFSQNPSPICSGIALHPFVGQGFNRLLVPDNMLISTSWGKTWLWMHNDYLNLIRILGISAIIPIALFIKTMLKRVRDSFYLIPVLGIAILCFVQATVMQGDRALAVMCILALAYVETYKEE